MYGGHEKSTKELVGFGAVKSPVKEKRPISRGVRVDRRAGAVA